MSHTLRQRRFNLKSLAKELDETAKKFMELLVDGLSAEELNSLRMTVLDEFNLGNIELAALRKMWSFIDLEIIKKTDKDGK